MIVSVGPLLWPVVGAACADSPGVDEDAWVRAQALAVDWLWAATGRRLGQRQTLVRPGNARSCGVEVAPYRVRLPGPVDTITAVNAFGGVVTAADYRLESGGWLSLVDGSPWPVQDWAAADGDEGYWTVDYLRGIPVPAGGQVAAGALACELYTAATDPRACKLPANVVQVVRTGVTITLDDLAPGSTGLAAVDQWVATVNPDKRTRRPTVWSPDLVAASARKPAVTEAAAATAGTIVVTVDGGFLG